MFEINHLKYAKQTYYTHCSDAFYYSYLSLKASFVFFIHGLIPCIYTKKGSRIIQDLNEIIIEKRNNIEKLIE